MRHLDRVLALALVVSSAAGCFVVTAPVEKATKATDSNDNAASTTDSANCGDDSGIPPLVKTMLVAQCDSCHGEKLSAPMALLTYDDLMAAAPSDDSRKVVELVLDRIKSSDDPMPPGKDVSVSSDDADAVQAWIDAGLPREETVACDDGDGDSDTSSDPVSVCSSDKTWAQSDGRGPRMMPGKACITCHNASGDDDDGAKKAIVQVGGTLYPTVREPDLCWGKDGSSADDDGDKPQVVITDADGHETTLDVEDTGNFSIPIEDTAALKFPIRAKVVFKGNEREMQAEQDSGDCNSCHTESGDNGAPGRIFLP